MSRLGIAAVTAVLLGVFTSHSVAGGDCRGNCREDKGGKQTQVQQTQVRVGVSQEQGQSQQARSDSRSSSQSGSQSRSQSRSQSSATGGSVTTTNNFSIPSGGLVRDNRTSTTSNTNTISVPKGAVQSQGGEGGTVDVNNSPSTEIDTSNDYEVAAAQASSVFTQACQTGSSGQVEGGGFNVVNVDAFCQRVDAARVWLEVHAYADRHNDAEMAEHAGQMFLLNIKEAQELVEYDEYPAKVDNFFSRMIRPVAVIAALILLI
jgi:hypothetical protein